MPLRTVGPLFVIVGIAMVVGGTCVLAWLRPRTRTRTSRLVATQGTVVGSAARSDLMSGWPFTASLVPVVEWRGPDGQVRTQVPDNALRTVDPPATGASVHLGYDPQDPARLVVAGGREDDRTMTWGGGIALFTEFWFVMIGGLFFLLPTAP